VNGIDQTDGDLIMRKCSDSYKQASSEGEREGREKTSSIFPYCGKISILVP
jgi:hypothetical protein